LTRYYDPRLGAGIAALITDKTCGVFMESPGSLTFEIQDVGAITKAARAKGVPTILDNTWSAGIYFKPFEHGVDLSIQALTKYQSGHADTFGGAVLCATTDWANRVTQAYKQLGLGASPDDAYMILRGMRTLSVRLAAQSASAFEIAQWLKTQPQVANVLHPGLPEAFDHALWKRDFTGASGLFGFVLKQTSEESVNAMLASLSLFGLGFSWGGFESLIVPSNANIVRSVTPWRPEGELIRVSIGLEHTDDLIADLAQGLAQL
jgi:cystathionine beta-lyase